MREILGFGVTVGLLAAVWCLCTGGSLMLALLAYSLGGTCASLLTAVFVAMAPDTTELSLVTD